MHRRIVRVAVLTLVAWLMVGCTAKPSEDDARASVEAYVDAGGLTRGQFKVVEFHKVNGVEKKVNGVPTYEMQFTTILESVAKESELMDASFFQREGSGPVWTPQGGRVNVRGTVLFRKSENGWVSNFSEMAESLKK